MPSSKPTVSKAKLAAKKKSVKVKKKVSAAVPPVNVAPVVEEASPPVVKKTFGIEDTIEKIVQKKAQIADMVNALKIGLRDLTKEQTSLCKLYDKQLREQSKLLKKNSSKRSGGSKPSGFAKPGYISSELCSFLGKPTGSLLARTDVTRYLTTYIKDHNLQNKNNKKEILCDTALKNLLQPNKGEVVTYFNLQSYMKRHYEEPSLGA